MNKKGSSIINIPLGLIGFFILVLVLVSLIPLQANPDLNNQNNITQIKETLRSTQISTLKNINETDNPIIKVTYSFINFIVYSSIEVSLAAVTWGSNNVDIVNPIMLLRLVLLCLIIPILFLIIKLLIIFFILIKEYIQNRKDKKELKKVEEDAKGKRKA